MLVIGMKQENQIEGANDLRLQLIVGVRHGEHHLQKVRRVFVLRFGLNKGQPTRFAIGERGDRANLRKNKGSCFVKVLGLLRRKEVWVITSGGVDHRRQDRHRVGVERKPFKVKLHVFVN